MQSDRELDKAVLDSKAWTFDPVTGQGGADVKRFEMPSLQRANMSFSGNERNHLFLNQSGRQFVDVSGVSGLDSPQDSRSFAVCDYDRDGWQDIFLLNTNTPVLGLFRNQLGSAGEDTARPRKMLALKFVGGNAVSTSSQKYGSRDGYGAKATVKLPNQTLIREHRCGEGLAAQYTNYMFFGIGEHDVVDSIAVHWPSGISQQVVEVQAGDLVTVYENAAESADGSGFEISRYIVEGRIPKVSFENAVGDNQFSPPAKPSAQLGMYTSVATWCPNCRKELPQLRYLREHFSTAQLGMVGAPVDKNDSNEKLAEYVAKHRPPYDLKGPWSEAHRENFNELVNDQFGSDLLPSTILTNREGQVLTILPGVPTVSDITRLLLSLPSSGTSPFKE